MADYTWEGSLIKGLVAVADVSRKFHGRAVKSIKIKLGCI